MRWGDQEAQSLRRPALCAPPSFETPTRKERVDAAPAMPSCHINHTLAEWLDLVVSGA